MNLVFRPYTPADADAVLRLNAANEPEVGPLDAASLGRLAGQSPFFPVAEGPAGVIGYLLALGEGADYGSLNYGWFAARLRSYLYIDRVAFAPEFRGVGAGREVYGRAEAFAASAGLLWLACEVNLDPPNPASLMFHDRLGFAEVGRQWAGGKQVSMRLRGVGGRT